MKSKIGKAEIHSVALNHHLPDQVVNDIIESVFKFTHGVIEQADRETANFPIIGLINFGKFFVTEQKKKFITEVLNDKKKVKLEEVRKSKLEKNKNAIISDS